MRKFGITLFALLFRRNIAFMLACVILILFASYVMQVRNRPYMSTVERVAVKEAHRLKAAAAEIQLTQHFANNNGDNTTFKIPSDLRLHHELNQAIIGLRDSIQRSQVRRRYSIKNLEAASKEIKKKPVVQDYYFDYNTVEQVLIMCCIFLCLVAIMFESGQFYETDPITGIQVLKTDSTTNAFYNTVLAIGAIVLIGSLIYYTIVFMAEVVGHVPKWVRVLFASKKTATEQHREQKGNEDDLHREETDDDFEMAEVSVYSSKLNNSEGHMLEMRRAEMAKKHAEMKQKESEKQSKELMEQMRKLKQKNNRVEISKKSTPRRAAMSKTNRTRKEMAQVKVNSGSAESRPDKQKVIRSRIGKKGKNSRPIPLGRVKSRKKGPGRPGDAIGNNDL